MERRGNGKTTPIRIITQVYAKEGDLIAEFDPVIEKFKGYGYEASVLENPDKPGYAVVIYKDNFTKDDAQKLADLINEILFGKL